MKNFIKFFILVTMSNLLIQNSIAQQSTFEIRGHTSCGTWIKERRAKSWASLASESWLVGYLSGIVVARHQDFLKGTDNESIFLWMDRFCNENLISDTSDGAQEIYLQLTKSKGLR